VLPPVQSRTGSRGRGKKGEGRIEGEYLDRALETFSGYLAADEVYDGPFCVLSIVDNRTFQRLAYRDRLRRGLPIGSGMVEGACKTVAGRRLKCNGARWLAGNADRMTALCCLLYSGQWETYWSEKAA